MNPRGRIGDRTCGPFEVKLVQLLEWLMSTRLNQVTNIKTSLGIGLIWPQTLYQSHHHHVSVTYLS